MKTFLLGVLASLFFLGTTFSSAQSNSPDAQFKGTLLDASGAGVGGVQITARLAGDPHASLWKATSTTDGAYSLTLPPGNYHVVFERTSFVTREFDVDLTKPGATRTLDLRLNLERVSSSVVVTAQAQPLQIQQTSAPVDVITRADMDQRLFLTLPDALLTSTGVAIGRTGPEGGTASVFINGGNSAYTKVLVDGTAVNEPGNNVDFSNFTLDNIDKVEIVRGAESAIYGTDAVSSVIQVITHRGATTTPELDIFADGGTFATGRGGAQLSGLLGNFDYSGAASYFSTNGPQGINTFINRTLSGNFGYRLGEDNQLRLSLRNNNSNAQTPGQTLLLPPEPTAHVEYNFFNANAKWDFATSKHWHHQLMGAESYNRQHDADTAFQFSDLFKYNRASLNAQSSYLLPNFAATAGYQYEVENAWSSSDEITFNHFRRNNQGGYLDFRYQPHPRATLNFGARAEANGSFGTRVVPRAGASLALLQGRGFWGETRLRVFYGQGIKEPRFDQSYSPDPCFPGNPTLKPDASKTWNTGIEQKLAAGRAKVSVDYFSNRFYDIVSFQDCFPASPCPVTPAPPAKQCPFGAGTYFNTDLARARGINTAAEIMPARWLRLVGNYTYDDSRVVKSPSALDPALIPGNHLIRRPVNSGSLTAIAAWRRLSSSLSGYFTGQRTDSDFLGLGLTRNPGYARFDLTTRYEFSRAVSGYFRAANLFDKSYQDAIGYPGLGRELRVGMSYRFGGKS